MRFKTLVLPTLLIASFAVMAVQAAAAEGFPSRTITMIVPFPPGGPTDTTARIIAHGLGEQLKATVVVENRSGASGVIGLNYLQRSAADGYTIAMLATPTLLAPHFMDTKPFDIVNDFDAVAGAYELPLVLVSNPKSLPQVTDLTSLIKEAKNADPTLNYTSAGVGSLGHLSSELLKKEGQFDMQHIPYKGSAPAVTDLLGGEVPVMFSDIIAVLPHIKAGSLKALAVGSKDRLEAEPEIPTVAEQGFEGFDAASWGGVLAPKGTPVEVIALLSDNINKVLTDPAIQERIKGAGAVASYSNPETFGQRVKTDYEKWGAVIKDNELKR